MRGAVGERVVPLRHVAIGRAGGGRTAAEVLVEEIAANGRGAHCEEGLGSCVVMRRPEMRCLPGFFSCRVGGSRRRGGWRELSRGVLCSGNGLVSYASPGSNSNKERPPMTWL